MLKFENVSKVYDDGFQAVKSVNFDIPTRRISRSDWTKWFRKIDNDENDQQDGTPHKWNHFHQRQRYQFV